MSLSETQNGDVSEDTLGGGKVKKALKQSVKAGLSEAQNGALSKTMEGGKVKKSLKQSVKVGLSEAQNGDLSNETVEDENVKKSPKKSAILTNGGAATQPPNSESKKKKKKKKRKMADDAGPGRYLIFFALKPFTCSHSVSRLSLPLPCVIVSTWQLGIPCTHCVPGTRPRAKGVIWEGEAFNCPQSAQPCIRCLHSLTTLKETSRLHKSLLRILEICFAFLAVSWAFYDRTHSVA